MIYGSNLDIVWDEDPKMLGVRLARYKFVSRMFRGYPRVIEVGCGSGWLSKVVAKEVGELVLTDAAPQCRAIVWNPVTEDWYHEPADGIFALDVLEHVEKNTEDLFMTALCDALSKNGAAIIGMPSFESQPYASRKSKESHVNCKTEEELRALMSRHFHSIFMFGMNDEVVHTGFGPMCHYRIALGVSKR